jgi:hypothetical protein
MSILGRIRQARPAPPAPLPAAAAPVPAFGGPELGEDDLEQVVGGLERVYVPSVFMAG